MHILREYLLCTTLNDVTCTYHCSISTHKRKKSPRLGVVFCSSFFPKSFFRVNLFYPINLFYFIFYTLEMDTRHSQLVLIEKRVEKANEKINEILKKLNWSRKELTQWYNVRNKKRKCSQEEILTHYRIEESYKHVHLTRDTWYLK